MFLTHSLNLPQVIALYSFPAEAPHFMENQRSTAILAEHRDIECALVAHQRTGDGLECAGHGESVARETPLFNMFQMCYMFHVKRLWRLN